jgi:hypothetical protein
VSGVTIVTRRPVLSVPVGAHARPADAVRHRPAAVAQPTVLGGFDSLQPGRPCSPAAGGSASRLEQRATQPRGREMDHGGSLYHRPIFETSSRSAKRWDTTKSTATVVASTPTFITAYSVAKRPGRVRAVHCSWCRKLPQQERTFQQAQCLMDPRRETSDVGSTSPFAGQQQRNLRAGMLES